MAQTDERELLETRDAILAVDEDERDLGTLIEVTNDLGGFYRHRSRLEESCQNFDMALDAAERYYGTTARVEYAVILINYAGTYRFLRNWDQAIGLYERAMGILGGLGAGNTFEYASALNNLGLTYQDMGRHEEALSCAERAHVIVTSSVHDWQTEASSLVNLASFALSAGDLDKASSLADQAFAIYDERDGGRAWYPAINLRAIIDFRKGKPELALEELRECADQLLDTFGENSEYASCLGSMAQVQEALGRDEEAAELRAQAAAVIAKLS